ncbi:hypothetical protein CSAL01_01574 [Colletotrichum salicis]|uniref:C2H2-type domain-containing protein n=1 Tax=Colletotrichum salicis TaxID=1209931 RepID=A0A135SHU6_9PEZI|nr:hypothetical protein CSAL01_01574 [Colletotrichum salicis]
MDAAYAATSPEDIHCPAGCGHSYSPALRLESHVVEHHSDEIPVEHVEMMIEASSEAWGEAKVIQCPLCSKNLSSLKGYEHHVGKHQEQLALSALPIVSELYEKQEQDSKALEGKRLANIPDTEIELENEGESQVKDKKLTEVHEESQEVETKEQPRDQPTPSLISLSRENEFFMPKADIHPDIITAAIHRFLGKDASVRPVYYEDNKTERIYQGYYLKAFKRLSPASEYSSYDGALEALQEVSLANSDDKSSPPQLQETDGRAVSAERGSLVPEELQESYEARADDE